MYIARVQVEEGFLDGLDLRFSQGLNVIIGARGTGKTSLIELIRFALGVRGFTSEAARRSEEHARAVLGPGQVIVTLLDEAGDQIVAIRSASEAAPRVTSGFEPPLIFSQTEIETLGLLATNRLRLIDGFVTHTDQLSATEDRLISEVRSLTVEIAEKKAEIEQLEGELAKLPEIQRQLDDLRPSEAAFSQASGEAASKAEELQRLTAKMSGLSVLAAQYDRYLATNHRRRSGVQQALQQWGADEAVAVEASALVEAGQLAHFAHNHMAAAANALQAAEQRVQQEREHIEGERLAAEATARNLRKEIEAVQIGAGQIARQGQQLRERLAQISSLSPLMDQRRLILADAMRRRTEALDHLDKIRDERFKLRAKVAATLNDRLGPRIRVEVERAGQTDAYAGAIATALRGSGLRYNDLSQVLARTVSPRELLEWAESADAEALADAAGLPRDRAARALSALRDTNLGEVGTLLVEDDAQFYLLDGSDHKSILALSMGQRCTVILPIILERADRILIVDQPEDHIDNAFIADTLIRAIVDRSLEGQIIFSTHNANIPVLGGASQVTQLGSDGRRGYVAVSAPLDDDASVKAITSVMEGGREAFRKRAEFYSRHH